MKKKQPKWKPIKMGERLPCWSFIRKMDGTVLPLTTIGGAFSGQDAYYLPVKDVIEIIKDFPKETVMDYEKKYKEAVKAIKELSDSFDDDNLTNELGIIFPELKESEGDRIRNWLICTLKSLNSTAVQIDGAYEMMLPAIAWLEKQGEQKHQYKSRPRYVGETELLGEQKPIGKPTLDVEIPFGVDSELVEETMTIPKGCYAVIEDNKVVIRKGEKPAEWSEEDSLYFDDICELLMNILHSESRNYNMEAIKKDLEWLKSLRERVQPQPKQEWSEEDKKMIESCIFCFEKDLERAKSKLCESDILPDIIDGYKKKIDWLKAFKDRVGCEVDCTTTKEWSEEDKKLIDDTCHLINTLASGYGEKVTEPITFSGTQMIASIKDRLRALVDNRPQNTWKPSNEQMKAVEESIEFLGCTKKVREDLKSLYEQLKKLREE